MLQQSILPSVPAAVGLLIVRRSNIAGLRLGDVGHEIGV
jgi:hypothetical protein